MEFIHKTVLLKETLEFLNLDKGKIYFDLTAGGGGLSYEIAKSIFDKNDSKLVSVDIDPDAVDICQKRLKDFKNVNVIHDNFVNIKQISKEMNLYKKIDAIVLDLGVSSFQIDNPKRGFSYKNNGPLDMRMGKEGLSAFDVINESDFDKLFIIIKKYSEERFAKKISQNIIKFRKNNKKVFTTFELVDIIKEVVPKYYKINEILSRVFQAFRIFINDEFFILEKAISNAIDSLKSGGRLLIITFHSLEDKIVKKKFLLKKNPCVCPKDFLFCICGLEPEIKIITKRVITPTSEEINENIRSRSAKLRVCEKIR